MSNNAQSVLKALLLALMVSFAALPVTADNQYPARAPAALGGYSPVSYFEQGVPEKGSAQFHSNYKGATYWFTDENQKQMFDAAPANFAPAFPNHCPYNLAMGHSEPIDPTNFKIVDGQLLLFHRSAEHNGRKRWEKTLRSGAMTERELIKRAQSNFINIKF
jgi:YHS domain-containing protein